MTTRSNRICLLTLVLGTLVAAAPTLGADRLYDQEPFDRITLDVANGNEVLDVELLELPNRKLPTDPSPSDKLTVRLLERPEETYELQWRSIARVELFEQMVLAEANRLVAKQQVDEAYDYFQFLERYHAKLEGLNDGMLELLHAEVVGLLAAKKHGDALAMLQEMHRRDPNRTNLDHDMSETTVKLMGEYEAKGDHRSSRLLLANLAKRYPDHTTVTQQETRLQDWATDVLSEASKAREAGQFAEASQLCRQASQIWPAMPEIRALAVRIHTEYPRVTVGVSMPAGDGLPGRLGDWGSRRAARLVYRTLTEYGIPGSDGGQYVCPVGKCQIFPTERRLELTLEDDVTWANGTAMLTGYDVSRRLLAMADPEDRAYRMEWADLFESVTVSEVYNVNLRLQRPHVRPDALLRTLLLPDTTPGAMRQPPPTNGPYVVRMSGEGDTTYLISEHYYVDGGPGQPQEIVERHFPKGALAIQALKRGEIQLLDRVNPWGLNVVLADPRLELGRYRAPLLHCLIPNYGRSLMSLRTFRRALVYGIDREAILKELTGGEELEGCRVVSGPFLPGYSRQDDLGYAYDEGIDLREHDSRMAFALSHVGVHQWIEAEKKQGREPQKMPRLVLAHPSHEIARLACQSIQAQLEVVGISIELRELPDGVPATIPEDVDLLYAELAIWEPVVDARRLLGEKGMSGGCSPYMSHALRQLERAPDWDAVREELSRIHRVAHDDVAVIPLWQLADHYARVKGFKELAYQPVSLYENVEKWQPPLPYAPGEK